MKVVVLKDNEIISRGTVVTAENYGTKYSPDWYVEYRDDGGQYRYVKQRLDGFDVVVLETGTAWEEFTAVLKATNEALYDVFDAAITDYISNILNVPGVRSAVMQAATTEWATADLDYLYNEYSITDLESIPFGYLWALAWKEVMTCQQ